MRFFWRLFVCVIFGNAAFTQTKFEEVNRHIVYQQYDSALAKIHLVEYPETIENLFTVIYKFGTYKDYNNFIDASNFYTRSDYQNLLYFLSNRVKKPKSRKTVHLDYVVLESQIINILANRLELSDALDKSNSLKGYLNEIEDKTNVDYELAQLYAYTFDALLAVIEKDTKTLEHAESNMKRALELGDTLLHLRYSIEIAELFIAKDDLFGYIEFYKDKLELAQFKGRNNTLYYIIADNLLDGLIFAEQKDHELIEHLLIEMLKSPKYRFTAYSTLLKYLKTIVSNKEAYQKIIEAFGFSDILSMILEQSKNAPIYLSNDELGNFYLNAARLFYELGEYSLSLEHMYYMINVTRQTYSQDLTNTIADNKIREVEHEKEMLLNQEKEKNRLFLTLGVTIFISLVFTLLLTFKLDKRSKILYKRNEEKAALLAEKDLLMQEIHHRVKNNFELVSTLLELQSYEVENKEAKEKLYQGQARIQSLSLIHNKLYESNQSTSVDMQQYIDELTTLVLQSANFDGKVSAAIDAHSIHLDIDTTVPIGLILNELLTNSCKYAFPFAENAALQITLKLDSDSLYKLTYHERGICNEEEAIDASKSGLGKVIIQSLVKQLQGRLQSNFTNGAHYEIWFKDKLSRKKIA